MNTVRKNSTFLGLAFVFQFVTSLTSGMIQKQVLVVPGNIRETMLRIAHNPGLMRTTLVLDLFTALGVIFLGVMLFLTLRKQNEKAAMAAMGFYIVEGIVLAVSKIPAVSLLRISQEYALSTSPALLMMGQAAYGSMNYLGNTLHMLAFCPGGILFYFLLIQSRMVPRILPLWGLITVFPCLIGTLTQLFGYTIPFVFYLPYAPFELVIGVWILVKGLAETRPYPRVFQQVGV